MTTRKTLTGYFFMYAFVCMCVLGLNVKKVSASSSTVNVWWPTSQATVSGVQPFKAMFTGLPLSEYKMYWQVDNGNLVEMSDNYSDYPHKEVSVDLTGWSWKGAGPYDVSFIAKSESGSVLGKNDSLIYISQKKKNSTIATATQSIAVVEPIRSAPPTVLTTNSVTLYVDPNSSAANSVKAMRSSNRGNDATLMDKIASSPIARWFGNWNGNINKDVNDYVSKAESTGSTAVVVAYNIPGRDCGNYSSGGANSSQSYKDWIQSFADGIGNRKAIVILEPDAVPQMDCLSTSAQNDRAGLLSYAVGVLKSKSNTSVYIDAGNTHWKSETEITNLLKKVGIEKADGFSLNVSNFISLGENMSYGKKISALLQNKHFVIDTSRDGSGSNGEWCNPLGRSLGVKPTTNTGDSSVDAYLWVKSPGESDGQCNGGPNAGVFWESYALDLARNAGW